MWRGADSTHQAERPMSLESLFRELLGACFNSSLSFCSSPLCASLAFELLGLPVQQAVPQTLLVPRQALSGQLELAQTGTEALQS